MNKYFSSQGIIIEQKPDYVILMDLNKGKIKYSTKKLKNNICRGAWVNSIFFNDILDEIKIDAVPNLIAKTDLLFLHHTLEVLNMATAWEDPQPEIKNHLKMLYSNQLVGKKNLQIIFLGQLFVILGLHSNIPNTLHIWLMQEPIWKIDYNYIVHEKNYDMINTLKIWLSSTINEYSKSGIIKTISFLNKA